MKILVIENEIYLAQKIVSRLLADGHICDFIDSANMDEIVGEYDIIILSTSLPSTFVQNVIKQHVLNSIVLLLVSYISDETVTNPINAGAKDYIMKPFIMDELVRKIYHYKDFKSVREELQVLREYMDFTMREVQTDELNLSDNFPLFIETNSQKCADKIAFNLAKKTNSPIKFLSLSKAVWQKKLPSIEDNTIIYLTDFQTLKKNVKEHILSIINDKKCIISTLEKEDIEIPFEKVEITDDNMVMENNSIMTINDYVKLMVVSYQHKYPDTELSKKLGISRKSLWEKRKKLGIEKRK